MKRLTYYFIATFFLAGFFVASVAKAEVGDHGGGHDDHGVSLKLGRYIGQLEVGGSGKKILAALDLFHVQKDDGFPKLKGIVKLVLGGLTSHEYVSYTYETVLFNPTTNRLAFEEASQDLMLTNVMIHGDMLMGGFRSSTSSATGTFNLYFSRSFDLPPLKEDPNPGDDHGDGHGDSPGEEPGGGHDGGHGGHGHRPHLTAVHLATPVAGAVHSPSQLRTDSVQSLAGEYSGTCSGGLTVLQIETRRGREALERSRNPFAPYHLTGSFGSLKPGEDPKYLEKSSVYHSGTYDFYTGRLSLRGAPSDLTCEVSPEGLTCGGCPLRKSQSFESLFRTSESSEAATPREFQLDRGQFPLIVGTPEAAEIDGAYSGYLHHEQLNQYQAMKLTITAFNHSDRMHGPNQLYISPRMEVFFGPENPDEKIAYRFERRPWLYSHGSMLIEGEEEAFGVVREWRKGLIILDWYSKNFGRVGTVELVKGSWPELPPTVSTLGSLSATYIGPIFHLNLAVKTGEAGERETGNPFYPLAFSGFTRVRGTGPIGNIEEGVYDFYTGAISLGNSTSNQLIGGRVEGNRLKLFVTGVKAFGYSLLRMEFSDYERRLESPGHHH